MINPSAFISYSWESDETKAWAKKLALDLRNLGIDAKIDQWELVPGDQMPHFMEKSVRENDYVLIICTESYKHKSENRIGGVGYEGDIMTSEVLQNSNHRKFIPILKSGTKETSLPSWLQGKYFINLSDEINYERNFSDLVTTLLNSREAAPSLGNIPNSSDLAGVKIESLPTDIPEWQPIKIKGILVDEVSEPKNDGTMGSALYRIPFELNHTPDSMWRKLFIKAWNHPPSYDSMHRPGIASVINNKIILDGTTIEEVEKHHKSTLKLAVEIANQQAEQILLEKKQVEIRKNEERAKHKEKIQDLGSRMKFD